jgi:hypothetical protein
MGRLVKGARYDSTADHADSGEIDRSFNDAVGALMERIRAERKRQELLRPPSQPKGKQYYVQGHFSEDGIPIPLKDNFRAETLEEAKRETGRIARETHNLEGYAVTMNLFDRLEYPRNVLHRVSIPAKKER